MTALRIGVVGVGHMGQRHAEKTLALRESGVDVTLAGVADADLERARGVASALGVRAARDAAALFREADAVVVAVPTLHHYEVVRGALEVHMRPACPPLTFSCKFLNFSRSRSELDLAGRKAILDLEGSSDVHLEQYSDPDSDLHAAMVERISQRLELTSLRYQRLDDMIEAIGLPREQLCTYCWNGEEYHCE